MILKKRCHVPCTKKTPVTYQAQKDALWPEWGSVKWMFIPVFSYEVEPRTLLSKENIIGPCRHPYLEREDIILLSSLQLGIRSYDKKCFCSKNKFW